MTAETKPGREPEAMVLVPREPTQLMLEAFVDKGFKADDFSYGLKIGDLGEGYRAMIAASPAVPSPAGNGVREGMEKAAKIAEGYQPQHELNLPIARQVRNNIAKDIRAAVLATPVSAEAKPVAWLRSTHGGYGMELSKHIAYALPEGVHAVYAAPVATPVSVEEDGLRKLLQDVLDSTAIMGGRFGLVKDILAALDRKPAESARADSLSSVTNNDACVQRNADGDIQASAPSGDTVARQIARLREVASNMRRMRAASIEASELDRAADAIETFKRDRDEARASLREIAEIVEPPMVDGVFSGSVKEAVEAQAARLAELEASLAQERSKREEVAEDERDRPLEHAVENGFTAYTIGYLGSQGAMMPRERAAARAALGEQT